MKRYATSTAVVLLVAGVSRHQLWEVFPEQLQAKAWNAIGAMVMLLLLAYVGVTERALMVWAVVEWWAYEEMLVLTCSLWRMVEPWAVQLGQEQCSARMGFRLGNISLVAVAILALCLLDDLRNRNLSDGGK